MLNFWNFRWHLPNLFTFRKKSQYEYKVGVCAINISILSNLNNSGINHAVLLLDNEIFEYGTDYPTYERHKYQDYNYNWDSYKGLTGFSYKSPDELDDALKKDGTWTKNNYDPFRHNCHDFVRFCLYILGAPKSQLIKSNYWPCLPRKDNYETDEVEYENSPVYDIFSYDYLYIRSTISRNNLGIHLNDFKNGCPIVLDYSGNYFHPKINNNGTLSLEIYNYSIGVRDGIAKEGSAIEIWETTQDNAAQQFKLKNEGDGYVSIHSYLDDNLVMTVNSQNASFIEMHHNSHSSIG